MATYSANERQIARLLNAIPRVKAIAKYCYQYFNYILFGMTGAKTISNYKVYAVTDLLPEEWKSRETFFGYYDKYPMNQKGMLLLNSTSYKTKKLPSADSSMQVLLIDTHTPGKVLLEIQSKAYNWQQGCRAHWLNDDLFILNDFDPNKCRYIARVFSASGRKEVKVFDYAVQDSFKTSYYLSINYRRIQKLRPDYGYRNLPDLSNEELKSLDNDGIWKIDYQSGEAVLLYSLSQIAHYGVNQVELNGFHKVNHLMINRGGEKFIFIHRFLKKGARFDRLLLADSEGNSLRILADNDMVSHCCWVDDHTVFAYLRSKENIDSYYYIDVNSGQMTLLNDPMFRTFGDGHPSSNGCYILSDSYPDKARYQHLILYDLRDKKSRELGCFFHGLGYKEETRCDLHPRLSQNADRVFFDSVFSGKRQLYYIDI